MTTPLRPLVGASLLLAILLALIVSADRAGATPQRRVSDGNAAGAEATCGAMGGSASTVSDNVLVVEIDGHKSNKKTSTTTCTGGWLGGMSCDNYSNGGSNCVMVFVPDPSAGDAAESQTVDDMEPLAPSDHDAPPSMTGASAAGEPDAAPELGADVGPLGGTDVAGEVGVVHEAGEPVDGSAALFDESAPEIATEPGDGMGRPAEVAPVGTETSPLDGADAVVDIAELEAEESLT